MRHSDSELRPVSTPHSAILAVQVYSGHYVRVAPKPLPDPEVGAVSSGVADVLGLAQAAISPPSRRFIETFSGARGLGVDGTAQSWATPYGISIYGGVVYPGGAGPSSDGYGDGRAISIGEVVHPVTGDRYELQLKGSGQTPFCRGADGRAVLRSSVREFLASEAMHHLGVSSTRALSLIASKSERVARPWYATSAPVLVHFAALCRPTPNFLRRARPRHFERTPNGA